MLVIHDEELVRQLQALAKQQQRPVEEVLKSLLVPVKDEDQETRIRQLKRKVYADARRYWEEVGDNQRLQLTDAELDEQFCCFDEHGIPRLITDHAGEQETSLTEIAYEARQSNIEFRPGFSARESRDVLDTHFAEDLQHRKQDDKR
jgi:hypothetical protein